MTVTEDREVESDQLPARSSGRRRTALAAVGLTLGLAVTPVVVPIVSPSVAPQAAAAAAGVPEKRCYQPIAGWLVQEVPCLKASDFLTQSQKECLIGLGVAFIIDIASGGVLAGPATAGAAVACGVKVMASTP
jgi:hypothetical protein